MKIVFSQNLYNFQQVALKSPDGAILTLGDICIEALLMTQANTQIDGKEKYKRYELAKALDGATEADLSAEDVTLIKKLVGDIYTPLVVGLVYDALEGKTKTKISMVR